MSLLSLIVSGVQILAGIILTATGLGGGLGLKLILSGALSLLSSFLTSRAGRGLSGSPTYGFDNLNNAAREGGAVPVVYGREVLTPSVVNMNLKQEGSIQTLYLLLLLGEGEMDAVEQVYLNDTKLESFNGAAWDWKPGTASQTAFPDFSQVGTGYSVSAHLSNDDGTGTATPEKAVYDMKGALDELILDFTWPGGLFKTDANGNQQADNVGVKIEYKAFGAADTAYATFPIPATGQGGGQWYGDGTAGIWKTSASTRSALRRMLRLTFDGAAGRPARGRYTVKVTGTTNDDSKHVRVPTLSSVIEIQNDSRSYANRALLWLKLPSSGQLNGGIPKVTVKARGIKCLDPRTAVTAWTENPAVIVRDLLLNARYGMGQWVTAGMLDDGVGGSFRTVADACDASVTHGTVTEAHWQLDYVLDSKAPASDHLTQMLMTFRATLFAADGLIRVSQDVAGASVRHFEDTVAGASSLRRNVQHQVGAQGFGDRSLLTAHVLDDAQRWTKVLVHYRDRDRGHQHRDVTLVNLSIAIGAITGAFQAGEQLKGGTSKGIATFVYQRAGVLYYTQADGATALVSGETVTGATSAAHAATTGAPASGETPERVLEVNLFGITRRTQVFREARYNLNRALMTPVFAQVPCGLGDLDLLPGDVVDVSTDAPGSWAAKLFTVLTLTFDMDGRGVVVAREYMADLFFDLVDTSTADLSGASAKPGGAPTSVVDSTLFGSQAVLSGAASTTAVAAPAPAASAPPSTSAPATSATSSSTRVTLAWGTPK